MAHFSLFAELPEVVVCCRHVAMCCYAGKRYVQSDNDLFSRSQKSMALPNTCATAKSMPSRLKHFLRHYIHI